MVQIASPETDPGWPRISAPVAALFRRGAQMALEPPGEWVEVLHAASLSSERMRPVADDPVLAAAVKRSNLANLRRWASANVREPGARVPAELGPEALGTARDLVRRGLDKIALDSYRTSQGVVWRRWMEICFELTTDPAQLRELLDVSTLSISTFIEDTITAVSARVEAERAELTAGRHAERRAAVTLLLEGAPIGRDRAEFQLGYRLTGPHTAAIVWNTGDPAPDELEAAAETLMRATGAGHRLTVVASTAALWLWLPVATPVPSSRLATELTAYPEVRVAVGRSGVDVDGFRRSHLDAAATQRMLTRLTAPQQIARYTDVQLVALLTAEPAQTDEFLADTLGELRHADADTRETVLVYVREQCSATRAAERLFTHRNTVLRRLARADALLPQPLADDLLGVAAALEVLRWRG
ncbi:PucR family transcriptional regulator [Actinoplanes sichuanensis]|uniref:PucR family transcriptional regulator n=1 Tax=Actinoplanes sichuanensis TaxID=512349 RepID=A0ABW4A4L3_9ACTN|nr:PucR family transcriptional regulator [Actinoplanes sichuanensis]